MQLSYRMPGPLPWLELYLFEVPVWVTLVAVSPAIFFVARRLPLFGLHPVRNAVLHLLPGAVILLAMFFIVEGIRQVAIAPLVRALGIATSAAAIDYMHIADYVPLHLRALTGFRTYIVFFFFDYFATVVLYHSVVHYRELARARLEGERLQTLLARSQLDALKLQLQPHFLFNTLNTVSSLMTRDVQLARRVLARLSDLLRQSLRDSARHEVSLRSELEFLDSYMEIQQARFAARLVVAKDIEARAYGLLVPRMILQPLVENSIRHGMTDGEAKLVISIRAFAKGDRLTLVVSDNGRGLTTDDMREGVGLRNTRERVQQLYRESGGLTLSEPARGGFEVVITLPAREDEDEHFMETKRDIA
jgi:signal transduction histidine kinase